MNGCRDEILFSSFFLNTPDFSLCLCFNIMEPANPVFRQKMPKKNLDLKNICGKKNCGTSSPFQWETSVEV